MGRITLDTIEREYVTAGELVQLLGLSKNVIYRLLHDPRFPVLRVGRRLVVPTRALKKLLEDPRSLERLGAQ